MPDTDPALLSAEDMLALYARRPLSPVEVLQAVTERVARLNPGLNAFAVMNPRALEAAGESEARWRVGRPLGLLDGVPCTVKDLVDLAGFPTRRGSRTSDPAPVADDAPIGRRTEGGRRGDPRQDHHHRIRLEIPRRLPAARHHPQPVEPGLHHRQAHRPAPARPGRRGFGPLHIGTDAGGSIRIPAAWCGLVGLKPTFGRVPLWPSSAFVGVSAAGPMTLSVRDAALMLSAMARYDVRDPFCRAG